MSKKLRDQLLFAIADNDLAAVRAALAAGADPQEGSDDNIGPMDLALGQKYFDMVDALLAGGADVNYRTSGGSTPLHTAYRMDLRDEDAKRVLYLTSKQELRTELMEEVRDLALQAGETPPFAKYLAEALNIRIGARRATAEALCAFAENKAAATAEITTRVRETAAQHKKRYRL